MRRWMLVTFTAALFGLPLTHAQMPMPAARPAVVIPAPPPTSMTSTPVVIIPESAPYTAPAAGCQGCAPQTRVGTMLASHFNKPRPAPECLQCWTIPCFWRMHWGGCRAYFGEGRFAPALPAIPHE